MADNSTTSLITTESLAPVLARASGQLAVTERLISKWTSDLLLPYRKAGKWGFCDTSGTIKIPCLYDGVGQFEEDDLAIFRQRNSYGLINKLGKVILDAEYAKIGISSEGLRSVLSHRWSEGNRINFISLNGQVVIENVPSSTFLDDSLPCFRDGLARLYDFDGHYGFMNKKGEITIPFEFTEAEDFHEGLAVAEQYFWDGKYAYGYIDIHGEWAFNLAPSFSRAKRFSNGWAVVGEPGAQYYYSPEDRTLGPFQAAHTFSEGMGEVMLESKIGFINTKGELAIDFRYDNCNSFSEGLASVSLEKKWGYVNIQGETVIPFSFDWVDTFKDGYATVCIDGEFGVIDRMGDWIFYPGTHYLTNFGNGVFEISSSCPDGYMHAPTGNWFYFRD